MTEVNIIAKEIQSLNARINSFITELRHFRKKYNVVDKSLVKNILSAVEEIDEFIGGEPKNYKQEVTDLDFSVLQYEDNLICSICKAIFENSVHRHIISMGHQKKVAEFENKQKNAIEKNNQLSSTNEEVFNSKIEDVKKLSVFQNLSVSGQSGKLVNNLSPEIQRIFRNGQTMENFTQSVMKAIDTTHYTDFVNKFQSTFKTFKVYMCGPLAFGLQDFFSTQEVFVDTGDTFHQYPPKSTEYIRKTINEIVQKLSESEYKEWEYFEKDESNGLPVLHTKLTNNPITYQLTFSNGLSYCKSLLVKEMISLHPVVQKSCILLQKVVNDFGFGTYFDSYVVAMLVICFYQKQSCLPSVYKLQKAATRIIEIGPWQVNFNMCIPEKYEVKLNGVNLENFLLTLGEKLLSPNYLFMCPFLPNASASQKKFVEKLTNNRKFHRYHDFCERSPPSEHLQLNTGLCLQDPIELNKNLIAHVPKSVFIDLKNVLFRVST